MIGHLNLARGFRGGERQTQLLVEGLAKWRLSQRLVARARQPLVSRLRAVPELDLRETSSSLLSAALACRGLSVAHVHDGRSVHAAALARRLFGVPYVITRRVDNPIRQSLFTRRAYRRAAAVVVLSQAIEREVHRLDPGIECTRIPDAISGWPRHEQNVAALKAKYR
ncbi:MAG: glycosyltransferase, partial [Pseudomonadota bacterium]